MSWPGLCVKVILQAQYVPDDPARQALVEWGGAWEDQRNWLATLALAMHEGGRAGAAVPEVRVREVLQQELAPTSVAQFLEAVRYRGGLLEERAELFQFVHLTFQEFLTARWLAKQRQEAWSHLRPHHTDAWWREVFLLTYGFAQMDHPPFAREYLEWLSTRTGDGAHLLAGLELAGAALLELERPDPEVCPVTRPTHPVVYVDWYDALAYCEWLTARLRAWKHTPEPLARHAAKIGM
jgi:hypothetical protein